LRRQERQNMATSRSVSLNMTATQIIAALARSSACDGRGGLRCRLGEDGGVRLSDEGGWGEGGEGGEGRWGEGGWGEGGEGGEGGWGEGGGARVVRAGEGGWGEGGGARVVRAGEGGWGEGGWGEGGWGEGGWGEGAQQRGRTSSLASIIFCHLTSAPSKGCRVLVSSGSAASTNLHSASKPSLLSTWLG
jgi:hypothetical protein